MRKMHISWPPGRKSQDPLATGQTERKESKKSWQKMFFLSRLINFLTSEVNPQTEESFLGNRFTSGKKKLFSMSKRLGNKKLLGWRPSLLILQDIFRQNGKRLSLAILCTMAASHSTHDRVFGEVQGACLWECKHHGSNK